MSDPARSTRPTISDDTAATAERLGVAALALEVVDVTRPSPGLSRIRLSDPALASVPFAPGQDLTMSIPVAGGSTVRRRYSIRRLHRDTATADIEVVLHGDGPGSRWAAAATPGQWVEAVGPRGKISVDPDATWHLFVGDSSYLPAAACMVESLPAGTPARMILALDADLGRPEIDTQASLNGPVVVRDDGERGLIASLAGLQLPEGTGRAYIGGESHLVASLRSVLVERAFPHEHISSKAYWRADAANADHGEPARD